MSKEKQRSRSYQGWIGERLQSVLIMGFTCTVKERKGCTLGAGSDLILPSKFNAIVPEESSVWGSSPKLGAVGVVAGVLGRVGAAVVDFAYWFALVTFWTGGRVRPAVVKIAAWVVFGETVVFGGFFWGFARKVWNVPSLETKYNMHVFYIEERYRFSRRYSFAIESNGQRKHKDSNNVKLKILTALTAFFLSWTVKIKERVRIKRIFSLIIRQRHEVSFIPEP